MLSLILPALLVAPQQPQTATELLPLQQLCGRESTATAPPWQSLLRWRNPEQHRADMILDSVDESAISSEGVFNILEQLEADAISEERLFLNTVGENLLVFGETARVRRVRKLVNDATQIIARPLQIEFSVWDASARQTPNGVMTPDEFARFGNNRKPIWQSISVARAGQGVSLEHMNWTHYSRTIEVEVAQKKTMSRPATDRFAEGCQAAVRAFPLIGGDDFAVFLQFSTARQRGVMRSVQTGLPGAADVELPRLETCFGACSGRIQNGGALAATMRGNASGGGQFVVTLRVSSATPPSEMGDDEVALLPCGALTTGALRQVARISRPLDEDDEWISHDDTGVFGRIPSDTLLELCDSILQSHEQTGDWTVKLGGGFLYVHASNEVIGKVRALVRKLQDNMIRNVEVQHVATLSPQEPDNNEQTLPALHELTLPTLLGREVVATRVHETNILAKIYVEIASEAGTLAPGIELLQSGAWLRARAVPLMGTMHLDMTLQASNAPIPLMRSVMPGGGALMSASRATTRLSHDGMAANGQKISHGDGPAVTIEGRSYRSTMSTTLRR